MKLLLADDHALFRDTLKQYITRAEPNATVITKDDFYHAMNYMRAEEFPDLVILDFRMPGMNGLEGFREMREQYPNVPLALMSGVAEPEDVNQALKLGAVGYFPKTLSGKSLLKAIQSVMDGNLFIPMDHQDSRTIMPAYYADSNYADPKNKTNAQERHTIIPDRKAPNEENSKTTSLIDLLSPREYEVFTHLSQGLSNKDIAENLNLKVVTIKLHVSAVCKKLQVQNRTQAAIIGCQALPQNVESQR
jgi:two-component system nitrate/nitrite response regulator NarL